MSCSCYLTPISSPHSYYPCVIGCGDENFKPDENRYYRPNNLDIDNKPQAPIKNYYIDSFAERGENGNIKRDVNNNPIMTIDLGLLPTDGTMKDQTSNPASTIVDLSNVNGGQ